VIGLVEEKARLYILPTEYTCYYSRTDLMECKMLYSGDVERRRNR
jgi:hypothetical protein